MICIVENSPYDTVLLSTVVTWVTGSRLKVHKRKLFSIIMRKSEVYEHA